MAERPRNGANDEVDGRWQPAGAPEPAGASLLRDTAAALEADAAGTPPAAVQQWPERLHASATALCLASLRIKAALLNNGNFAQLTDPTLTTEQAGVVVREFNALLETAMEALVDLTGYENPDQEYPDLTSWFEFRCPNVVYGRQTVTFYGHDRDEDRPSP
jgi:hypothetical protein